jgi:hypothetical protein
MQRFKLTVRDLCWLIVVVALSLAIIIDRGRHRAEITRLEDEARTTIHGLSLEVWKCCARSIPRYAFSPATPLPSRYDWHQGSIVPEWAEEPGWVPSGSTRSFIH